MPRKDPHFCQKVRDRIDKWEKFWTINRSLYYEWIDFVLGDQWREDESKLFERYNKIPLMVNKLGVLANHLIGEYIQNTPNLQIMPEEDVPPETADVRAALIKNISLNSDAKTVYQTTLWQAIIGGFSAYRVGLEYLSDYTFDQEPRFYAFTDPNHCYWDIAAKHPCKIDGMFGGFKTRMSREKFRHRWGKDIESQIGTVAVTEDSTMAFADDDSITQIDDYERDPKKVMIYKLSNGKIIDQDEYKSLEKTKVMGKRWLLYQGQPVSKVDERETIHYSIKHRQLAGDFVLDETDFPTEDIPIIFADQKSYYTKQGQQITRSFFKDVKDAQKYLNYLMTQSAYIMKISRYDQFIAPRKAVASPDVQALLRDPSVVRGALFYDETPSGAKLEQIRPPELSPSLQLEYSRTLNDIQTGTGMYNAQLGEAGTEVSGRAIEARTQRGTKNTAVPYASMNLAIATGGMLVNQMIPKVYDTQRQLILQMPQSESQALTINKPMDEYGTQIQNDMTKGRYKIRLKPGPSYEGEKELALESLQSVLAADKNGQVFPMIADLYAENLPLDNNIEIRNRLRTMVPQEIIEAGKTGKPLPPKQPQPSPEMLMMQLKQQEIQQRAQQAQIDAQMKMKEIELKQSELQRKAVETQQDISLSWAKLESEKEEAAAELQQTILRFQGEAQRIGADLEINRSDNLIKVLTHHSKLQHEKELHQSKLKDESNVGSPQR
jgi:Phage P22-like portal protein